MVVIVVWGSLRSAYERPPVDRRVRERFRTGFCGTSDPGRTGQNRREPQDRWFSVGNSPCIGFAFFAQNWHTGRGKMRVGCTKRSPLTREVWRAKIGTLVRTFFSPLIRGGPFVKVLDRGLCRQLAHWLGPLSQIDKNRWKSMKIDENHWKSWKIAENWWKINENRWKSLFFFENRQKSSKIAEKTKEKQKKRLKKKKKKK